MHRKIFPSHSEYPGMHIIQTSHCNWRRNRWGFDLLFKHAQGDNSPITVLEGFSVSFARDLQAPVKLRGSTIFCATGLLFLGVSSWWKLTLQRLFTMEPFHNVSSSWAIFIHFQPTKSVFAYFDTWFLSRLKSMIHVISLKQILLTHKGGHLLTTQARH